MSEVKNKLKILYVTNFWSGFADVVNQGQEEPKGMPGFNLPLKKLIDNGVQVDFVVLSYEEQVKNNTVSWLGDSRFYFFKGLSLKNLNTLRKLISSKEYKFVYGQGAKPAFWANLFANIYNVACGVRLYGTFMGEFIGKNFVTAFLKHPYEFALYNMSKKFLLITDDGTKGDEVCNHFSIKKRNYDFYFWVNGIDIDYPASTEAGNSDLNSPYLFYPARFDRWKRQDMAIDILNILNRRGVNIKLLLCGHYYDKTYVEELRSKVKKYKLDDFVIIQESLPKSELYQKMVNSTAMLYCYDFSNFGNVFIESSSLGALNIVRNDDSCNRVITHGETGILFDSVENAAESIQAVIEKNIDSCKLRLNCKARASNLFSTWETRALSEVELIYPDGENYAREIK